MPKAIFGRKIGMTQIFSENGESVPVTVVKVGPCKVIRKKSAEGLDKYSSIVIGFETVRSVVYEGELQYKMNMPKLGVFKAAGLEPNKSLHEVRVSASELDKYEVGQDLDASLFVADEIIDVVGTSKGGGFTGVMKRHNFKGTKRTHGEHETHRHGGSIGTSATPGRVVKGTKMAGQNGNERVTIQNLTVHSVDLELNLIIVKGSIPGPNGSVVRVQDAAKKRRRASDK